MTTLEPPPMPASEAPSLAFTVETPEAYDKTGFVWKITARAQIEGKTKVVGVWERDRFAPKITEAAAQAEAAEKLAALQSARLFVIHVNDWAIDEGQARDCHCCAIAQALWKKQREAWGHDPFYYSFSVCPYNAWDTPEGINYGHNRGPFTTGEANLPPEKLPLMVYNYGTDEKPLHHTEPMEEWAQDFDDWAEYQHYTDEQYRQHINRDGERPTRPTEAFFVLNLDEFEISEPFRSGYTNAIFPHAPDADE